MKLRCHTAVFFISLFASLMLPYSAGAQDNDTSFTKNAWHDYEGTIGDTAVQMSFFLFDNDSIRGNYVYKKFEVKIPLVGRYINGNIELTEYLNHTVGGHFKSTRWQTYTSNVCEGVWTDAGGTQKLPFSMQPTDIAKGTYTHRYTEFNSDTVLENFMRKIKYAILTSDKEWIADNVLYPIDIHFHYASESTPKSVEMKNKKVFLDKYDMIFNTAFKNRIRKDVPCNLWGNYMGYMLGNGDIWVNPMPNGNKIKITSINN